MKYKAADYKRHKSTLARMLAKSPNRNREHLIAELAAMSGVPLLVWYEFLIEIEGTSEKITNKIAELERQ